MHVSGYTNGLYAGNVRLRAKGPNRHFRRIKPLFRILFRPTFVGAFNGQRNSMFRHNPLITINQNRFQRRRAKIKTYVH